MIGRDLGPRISSAMHSGLTADCTELEIDSFEMSIGGVKKAYENQLCQIRPAFGGQRIARVRSERLPQMATVRPGVFPRPVPDTARGGIIERICEPAKDTRVKLLKTESRKEGRSIAGAKRLVIAGRGIGYRKNLALVEELAALLDADWGCSRPLVENGWCDSFRQVGQTGVSVAPELLISLGVSGAVQHTAGTGGAKTVIAVNKDPEAQIFASADYAVEGDCVQFMKELIAELRANPLMSAIWGNSEEYNG